MIHEMTHGITNRMTGGGTGRCLQTTEAGGMGEGWSDAMAEYVLLPLLPPLSLLSLPYPLFPLPSSRDLFPYPLPFLHSPPNISLTHSPFPTSWMAQTSANTTDFVVGQYVSNRAQGLRSFPYSTSANTNPLRFSSLQQLTEVHDIGEVWANMLHQVCADIGGLYYAPDIEEV